MLPISETNPNIRRGPKNSEEFIQMCNDIHYDIVKLFSVANEHTEDIKYNMDLLMVENYFLQNKIAELEANLSAAKKTVVDLQDGNPTKVRCNTFRTQSDVIVTDTITSDKTPQVDTLHGLVTIPYTSVSKASIVDYTGEVYIPPTLEMEVSESTDNVDFTVVNDPNVMRTFDCDNSSCWMHTSAYNVSETVNEIYFKLDIKLPLQSVNNAYVNAVSIKPVPEYALDIVSIQYMTPSNQTLQDLPNFPTSGISQAKKTLFLFPPTEISEIVITFKQPYYFVENNMRYFHYGMQEIGVYYYDFKTTEAYVVTRFSITDENKYFKVINTPVVSTPPGCPSNVGAYVSHELFFPSGENETLLSGDISPGNSTARFGEELGDDHVVAYVLTKITRTEDLVPALDMVEISYLTR